MINRPDAPLWGRETDHALANFAVSGRTLPVEITHALAAIKATAAAAHARRGLLDQPRADAITAAANRVQRGEVDEHFMVDVFQTGSGTSTNMNVNEVVARLAGDASGLSIHPNDHVNLGQSSNDAFPTAVALAALRAVTVDLLPAVDVLVGSFARAATRFALLVRPGRTHLMDAVPVTFGAVFRAYTAQLTEARERIADCLSRTGRVPLGGTAVGNGLNAVPGVAEEVVALLAARFAVPLTIAPDRLAAQGSRDGLVELSAQLRGLAMALMKIANDIRSMASGPATGLGEIRLPELQAGSSIMPGKVNPVMCEMITQVAAQVYGHDATIALAGSQGAFELNTYQPVIAANLLDSVGLLARGCTLFAERCIDGIEVNEAHARALAESSTATAAAMNGVLGYDRVAALVRRAVATRRSLLDVVIESGELDEATARRLLDVDRIARGEPPAAP